MFQIEGLTDEPKQKYRLPVVDSEIEADMSLTWLDTQSAWFMDVSYEDFSVKNMRVTFAPNVLVQFENRAPFGLMVTSSNKQDPFTLQSFSDGTCSIFILTKAEVKDLEADFG